MGVLISHDFSQGVLFICTCNLMSPAVHPMNEVLSHPLFQHALYTLEPTGQSSKAT